MVSAALLALLSLPSMPAASGMLLERLRSDHAAMVSAENDFHRRRKLGSLVGTEAADYASYVASLHRRVAEDCVALEKQGAAIPEEFPCPEYRARLIAPAAIEQATEQTSAETTAALDADLLSGLGEFDEMLLREQQRVKAAAPPGNTGSTASYSGSNGGSGSYGGTSNSDRSGQEPEASGNGAMETYGQGAGPGSQQTSRGGKPPPDTRPGSDDDVVARQLREAAEKETDPELKKKLWEEYRNYKQGTS